MSHKPYKLIELNQTCSACPTQYEGRISDGRPIYIRYRWGYLSVRLGSKPRGSITEAVMGEEIFGVQYEHDLAGILEAAELIALTKGVLDFSLLKEKLK